MVSIVNIEVKSLRYYKSNGQQIFSVAEFRGATVTLIIINTTNQAQQRETAFMTAFELTLLSCMSRLAPFFKSTSVASTLFTAAAQWRADFPRDKEQRHVVTRAVINNKDAKT